jgi:iron complex transport system substrate-binding protein
MLVRPRVASVLPSATEILCFIGGGRLLVGRSHEDNYPATITHLPVLTGQLTTFTTAKEVDAQVSAALSSGEDLYSLDTDLLRSLAPLDVILTQDLCQVCAINLETVRGVARTLTPRPKVVSLNPETLEGVLDTVLSVGDAVGMTAEARAAHSSLLSRIDVVDEAVVGSGIHEGRRERPSVAFIEWPEPLYVGGHWTPELIARAGGAHPLNAERGSKSFPVPPEAIVDSAPDIVVICPCGLDLPATRKEAERLQQMDWWNALPAVRNGRVALVDGDAMFNRPGPRLVDALEWLASILLDRPDLMPADFPFEWLEPTAAPAAATSVRTQGEGDGGATAARTPPQRAAPQPTPSSSMDDIEEAHRVACSQGLETYTDPRTGYTCFTQLAAMKRGRCCGSGCRHCPYDHERVPAHRRANMQPPIVISPPAGQSRSD